MVMKNLKSMSVDALLKLRNEVGAILSRRADALKKELASLGADYADVGRIALYGRKKAKKTTANKVAPKYRNKKTGATWAGRGAQPRWLVAELRSGKKLDDFLIAKGAKKKGAKR